MCTAPGHHHHDYEDNDDFVDYDDSVDGDDDAVKIFGIFYTKNESEVTLKKRVKTNQKSCGAISGIGGNDDVDDDDDGGEESEESEDVEDDDDGVDDLPEEQVRAEEQFLGSVEPAQDSGFSAPKRKHCCSLDVGRQHI